MSLLNFSMVISSIIKKMPENKFVRLFFLFLKNKISINFFLKTNIPYFNSKRRASTNCIYLTSFLCARQKKNICMLMK